MQNHKEFYRLLDRPENRLRSGSFELSEQHLKWSKLHAQMQQQIFQDPNMVESFYEEDVNPNTHDRFTPSHARCAEKCGSALTNRKFGKK